MIQQRLNQLLTCQKQKTKTETKNQTKKKNQTKNKKLNQEKKQNQKQKTKTKDSRKQNRQQKTKQKTQNKKEEKNKVLVIDILIKSNTQKEYVDEYQIKMKTKYKNGKIIDEETQKKRYNAGRKANWRNPNSTDVKIITEQEYNQIRNYINKYITKQETEKNQNAEIKITRYWSCNKKLTLLKNENYS